jgi:threonine aldolase
LDGGVIDLRSDTVTRPTDAMRAAMASAPVGDDQFGEDPSVNALQEQVAALLGKQAALWLPSGTMANQVALRTLTQPGDEVVVGTESHAVWHEAGASARNNGVQLREIGTGGVFDEGGFVATVHPRGHMLYPPTTLVEIENTHNRAGGVVWDQATVTAVCSAARERDVASYLDGARLWNAAVALGRPEAELAGPFDLVGVALSKGLGAPAGSLLAGSREAVGRAVRQRRMLGGAMRQAGILAAAGSHAVEHHRDRLADDHANARVVGTAVAAAPGVTVDLDRLRTNIVVFRLDSQGPDAATVVERARAAGVLVLAFAPRTVRAVTHLDVTRDDCVTAGEVLHAAVAAG